MELLFKREQTSKGIGRINFKLWGKLEPDEDEKLLIDKYKFNDAILIEVLQPDLRRRGAIIGFIIFLIAGAIGMSQSGVLGGLVLGLLAGVGAAYWWMNEKRETILVKDLLHGRHFSCDSVVELARKEAWLETISSYFRQVMESTKHWDGTARHELEALPKDEARNVILRGL